ncbi:MAG: WXG100 family type VII secretion target [Caldilineaceae bacterium]
MSAEIIQAQYETLDAMARRFGARAEANQELQRRVQARTQALQQGGWEGRGAAAFLGEMHQELFPAMQRLTGALAAARTTMLQIKAIMQAAEQEAAAPFQENGMGRGQGLGAGAMAGAVTGGAFGVAGVLSALLQGVTADALLPQRFRFRSLPATGAPGKTAVAALMDMLAGKPGKGLPLIRFDGPHPGAPTPHLNINPKLTGVPDPHTPISPRLLSAAGRGARLLEGLNKVALPVAITLDVFRLGAAYHNDGYTVGSETKQTIGSVAGGWGGAFAGAQVGALSGAWLGGVVGSAFPGVGNVVGTGVGGFLGGLVGGIGGAFGGSWAGEQIGGLF